LQSLVGADPASEDARLAAQIVAAGQQGVADGRLSTPNRHPIV
jgi:hypothetical protein